MAKKKLKKLTKWMLWLHRYTGFALSLLFLFWFLSGFVMMYKDFPYLSKAESLQRTASIPINEPTLEPWPFNGLTQGQSWESIKMVALFGRPVYQFQDKQGNFDCFFADTGEKVAAISIDEARQIALDFMDGKHAVEKVEPMGELDQWTPRTRFMPYLPAYKVFMEDGQQTVCYVSSVTGEVFQKLNTADKIWAWLGAIPHWIYFKDLRIRTQLWRDIVIALSMIGIFMCTAGLYMGIIRIRRKKHNKWAFSPYKKVWFKWHHYTGFIFGLFTFTWILSGFFSMNPWKWSPSRSLGEKALAQWQGGALLPELFTINPFKALGALNQNNQRKEVRELVLIRFGGKPYYRAHMADGSTSLFRADGPFNQWVERLGEEAYIERIHNLHKKTTGLQITELTDYDAYYYDKHSTKPLPVLKVDINDRANTTYYINPKTTNVMLKYENTSRVNRWVYHGLHSLDFPALFFRRPLWDIVVIVLMLGGTSVSITGLVLTWKWLKRKMTRRINLKGLPAFHSKNKKTHSI
ncbi:MAG: PepSY domain-containing protein [Bacteroidota bacterium]